MRGASVIGSHGRAFVEERLEHAPGASLAAKDLEAWCAACGHKPLSHRSLPPN